MARKARSKRSLQRELRDLKAAAKCTQCEHAQNGWITSFNLRKQLTAMQKMLSDLHREIGDVEWERATNAVGAKELKRLFKLAEMN